MNALRLFVNELNPNKAFIKKIPQNLPKDFY